MSVQYVTFDVTVTCRVDCEMERNDYGVKGSPVWYEPNPDTIEVSKIAIDEINLDVMPKELLEHLEELASEAAYEKDEWHE